MRGRCGRVYDPIAAVKSTDIVMMHHCTGAVRLLSCCCSRTNCCCAVLCCRIATSSIDVEPTVLQYDAASDKTEAGRDGGRERGREHQNPRRLTNVLHFFFSPGTSIFLFRVYTRCRRRRRCCQPALPSFVKTEGST